MKDEKNIGDALKVIYFCLLCIPGLIGLIMIASGNGTSTKKTTTPTYNNSVVPQMRLKEDIRSSQSTNYQIQSQSVNTRSSTPDDAYDEGYDNGYEQGRYDGRHGHSCGYNYDNGSDYYNYFETMYQGGYEAGYEDGYSSGKSEYEDNDW